MRDINADVWLLQELTTSSRYNPGTNIPEIISQTLELNGVFVANRTLGTSPNVEGIGIFSRYPISSHLVATLSQGGTLRGTKDAYRRYLQTQVAVPFHAPLTFGLAHLSYPLPLGIGAKQRTNELAQLLGHITAPQTNYIFGGDFNASPRSKVVSEVGTRLRDLGPSLAENSWHLYNGEKPRIGRRLDYAFATPDVKASATLGDQYCSNHRPIIVEIDLRRV